MKTARGRNFDAGFSESVFDVNMPGYRYYVWLYAEA